MNINNLCGSNYTNKALRKLIERCGNRLDSLIALSRADCSSLNPTKVERIMAELNKLEENIKSLINTEDPRTLKLPSDLGSEICKELIAKPGPWLGQVMKQLKIKLVEGEISKDCNFVEEGVKIYNELNTNKLNKEEDKLLQLSRRPF
jgi:hypothetical protein